MNLLADEGVDAQVVEALRADGHAVAYVAEMSPGVSDEQVLAHANATNALLLTADKDFGELVYRLNRVSQGVVLLRLAGLSPQAKARVTCDCLRSHGAEMGHGFTVVSPGMLRVRHDR